MKALLIPLIAIALAGCGSAGQPLTTATATTATHTGIILAAGQGDETFYMMSDNVNYTSPDTANIRAVTGLPDGSTEVCQFTVSQGVHWAVWTTGADASTRLARAFCQQHGQ